MSRSLPEARESTSTSTASTRTSNVSLVSHCPATIQTIRLLLPHANVTVYPFKVFFTQDMSHHLAQANLIWIEIPKRTCPIGVTFDKSAVTRICDHTSAPVVFIGRQFRNAKFANSRKCLDAVSSLQYTKHCPCQYNLEQHFQVRCYSTRLQIHTTACTTLNPVEEEVNDTALPHIWADFVKQWFLMWIDLSRLGQQLVSLDNQLSDYPDSNAVQRADRLRIGSSSSLARVGAQRIPDSPPLEVARREHDSLPLGVALWKENESLERMTRHLVG